MLAMLTLSGFFCSGILPSYAQDDPAGLNDGLNEPSAPMYDDPMYEVFNAAIDAPQLEAPLPDSLSTALTDPPVGVPTLSWAAVPDATRYNVQISVSEGFATPLVNQNTSATSFTHKQALADGTYFWRVRAEVNREWGNFSDPWYFHKDWSAEGLVKPVLTAPDDDPLGQQVITSFSPEHFSWEPVVGAAAYNLEISVSPSFNDPDLYRVTTLKPNHTPVHQFENSQYYWRVIPIDIRDHAGAPSEVRTFTFGWNHIPTLLTPENYNPEEDSPARFLPRFTWTAVPGAANYILEISSQENFTSPDKSVGTSNTSYTPEATLANNTDYFWRVRAVSSQGVAAPPSETRRFVGNWVQPPVLLSPPAFSINHIYPYFSWTPVAGAERYQLQISNSSSFDKTLEDITLDNATSYTQPEWKSLNFVDFFFWRVRAIDAQNNTTDWSSVQSFRIVTNAPPNLIYPEPYYEPDAEGMPVHTDRTIAHPVFVWDTTHDWNGDNGSTAFTYPDYYLLEVATDFLISDVRFSITSAGQAAAPTRQNPFNGLVDGQRYYWRVTPMRAGSPMASGTIWETRIDRTVPQLPLDSDATPDLIHPADGFIAVESAPVLGWLPVANADHYEVQVSRSRNFDNMGDLINNDRADALFAYYVPWQGRQDAIPPGAYWWRVHAKDANNGDIGDWSVARRFMVMDPLMTGNPSDYPVPTSGTLLTTTTSYDPALSRVAVNSTPAANPHTVGPLHVVLDRSLPPNILNWIVAFGASNDVPGSVSYALYFDVNQTENVGGAFDPRGKPVVTDPLYRPEYIIYLDRSGNTITGGWLYSWTGSQWQGPLPLADLVGQFSYDPASQAVQVIFPYTTIIHEETDNFSGALALTVFSTGNAGAEDVVPHQPGAMWDQPALFTDMPTPLYPFDTPLSNPTVFHELPTLRWRMPYANTPDGYIIEVARHADFTKDTIVESWETFESKESSLYGPMPTAFHSGDSYEDEESYYWRVRYRHEKYDKDYDSGPWSQPMRFKLTSYQVGNPSLTLGNPAMGEVAPATPSFVWERVEGAAGYTIQIDNEFNMNSPFINKKIDGNSYTALETLADGTYYWRVAMRRSDTVLGQWMNIISFTKSSLVPTLIGPISDTVVNAQPTFVWAAAISNTGELHAGAARYRLQWDDNPQFNSPSSIETEATSYTPLKGQSLTDGFWYWRVAAIDADGRRGPDSAPARFYKEYLRPETLSPVQGSSQSDTITFEWTPLDGAAYYNLEIDDNEAFDSPIQVKTDNTRYTHLDKFAAGDYHWRVQMVDKDNRPGPTIPGGFSQGPEIPDQTPSLFVPSIYGPTSMGE